MVRLVHRLGHTAVITAVVAALLVSLSGPAAVAAPQVSAPITAACQGAFGEDSRLGPATLPKPGELPVGPLTSGYQRTGQLTPTQFLDRYWDSAANNNQGSWRYPAQDGFLLNPAGQPITWVRTLAIGTELDRFGSEFGSFLAPAGLPYANRSIPPQSLNTFDPAYPCNYHKYRVIKAFAVSEGPIAGWFEQPGLGVQEKLERSLVPGDGRLNVAWLLANNYLLHLN